MCCMRRIPAQVGYWERVAHQKRFTHPLNIQWMRRHFNRRDYVLDYGCGYGRTLAELKRAGYENVIGVDSSQGMLMRCRSALPLVNLVRNDGQVLPFRPQSIDAVLLFTLLTCLPQDDDQRALVAKVRRVLRPGGVLYISDLLVNRDKRNVERYERFAEEFGIYGVFELPEGVIVRHHRKEWVEELTARFDCIEYSPFSVITMNGNASAAFQYLGRAQLA